VDNYFAETEQVASCVSNVVQGIDFTDDPMLQARLFSYLDTQLTRLGSPNFAELPINRPLINVHNLQQDGHMRHRINTQHANYYPNSISQGYPTVDTIHGFTTYPEQVSGVKTRLRSPTFSDYFTQASIFWFSQTSPEQQHIVDAYCFELGKVTRRAIQQRYVYEILTNITLTLATKVATCLGLPVPTTGENRTFVPSPALSILLSEKNDTIAGLNIAVLVAPGFDSSGSVLSDLRAHNATVVLISLQLGTIGSSGLEANQTFVTTASVLYDAVYVPGGAQSISTLQHSGLAAPFIQEAFRHEKPIGGTGEGANFVMNVVLSDIQSVQGSNFTVNVTSLPGIILSQTVSSSFSNNFIDAVEHRRFFDRAALVPPRD